MVATLAAAGAAQAEDTRTEITDPWRLLPPRPRPGGQELSSLLSPEAVLPGPASPPASASLGLAPASLWPGLMGLGRGLTV